MCFSAKKCLVVVSVITLTTIFGVVGYMKYQQSKYIEGKILAYLDSPVIGDNIVIKSDKGRSPYTILKVTNVEGGKIVYTLSSFSFSTLEGVKDQILNPQIDLGQGSFEVTKDKLRDFNIVDIYGQLRFVART